MNRDRNDLHLQKAFAPMPEDCRRSLMSAVRSVKEETQVKRASLRAVLIAAILLVLLTAAAYAAFSSQVAEWFGQLYGRNTQEWLSKGDVATLDQPYTMGDVTFTLEEVVYRDNGLYGTGTIAPREGSHATLIAEDCTPDEPFGYDVHGAGGEAETAPEGTQTVANVAKERGGSLLMTKAPIPDRIGVDGGELLAPGSVGISVIPQRDGSLRYVFEVTDAIAVGKGTVYTVVLNTSYCEMTPDGAVQADTRLNGSWTVEFTPVPMGEPTQTPETPATAAPAPSQEQGAYPVTAPDEYLQTGTMPIYRATARDFGQTIKPEMFNQSGVAEDRGDWLVFKDEATLSWSPEALFYEENSGWYNGNEKHPEFEPDWIRKPTLANQAFNLASWATYGWPVSGQVYTLERTELEHITLSQAQAVLEERIKELGLTGYACDGALDMSTERIRTLGNDMNRMLLSGEMGGNAPTFDYDAATVSDEGYYLSYHKLGSGQGQVDIFSVYAYVTERGIVYLSVRDMYTLGDVYDMPDALIDPQAAVAALPGAIAASQYPEDTMGIVDSVHLTYEPMRAANKKDGMVMSPVWLVLYHGANPSENDAHLRWAEFDAVTGTLLSAIFK